jgi:hypothetical protein
VEVPVPNQRGYIEEVLVSGELYPEPRRLFKRAIFRMGSHSAYLKTYTIFP